MKRLAIIFVLVLFLSGCADLFYQPQRAKEWPDLGVHIAVVSVPGEDGTSVRRDFVIRSIRPQSPAAFGKIEPGDVLIALDDQRIDSVSTAVRIMQGKSKFDTLLVTVERAGETRQILISLANAEMRSDI
tara:strand:+ start:210 stop:599 length:390 start_codon:yes stop_codon:yes gene_type:complete